MADEYDDEGRLRRLLGDYAPDEEQWFPSEGEPPYEQQGPPEPEAGGATDPQVYGRPAPEPGPSFTGGAGDFREAAPPPFDPRAEVARMTAPPPPPIRVYAHAPGGLQEISQVEGSQGQPVMGGSAATMGAAGQALLAERQAIIANPYLTPQTRASALADNHKRAGELVMQSMLHGHGMPAQDQQFSMPQQQQLARLDAAEDQANQKLASKEWDVGMHHDVMEQLAEQRQAIKSKAIPKGPTMQEQFDGHVALGPHGEVMTPVIDKEGHVHDWKQHKTQADTHADELVKLGFSPLQARQLATAPELKKMGKLTPEDEARLNAMKPLYGHLVKGAAGALETDAYEPPDQLAIRKQAQAELIAEHTTEKNGQKVITPYTPGEFDKKVQDLNYAHHKWYDDIKAQRAAKLGGAAPGGQGAPPPPPGVRQQLGQISNQAFAAKDDGAFRATAELLEIQRKYPAGLPMIRDPAERAAVIERLKAIKPYYPTLQVPEK